MVEVRCPKCDHVQESNAKVMARCVLCKKRWRVSTDAPTEEVKDIADRKSQRPESTVENLVTFGPAPDWSSVNGPAEPETTEPTIPPIPLQQDSIGKYFASMGKCLIPALRGSTPSDEDMGALAEATFEMGGMMFTVTNPEERTEVSATTLMGVGIGVIILCIALPKFMPDGIGGLLNKIGKKKEEDDDDGE